MLSHAVEVVRRHRALWVLGFLWALVGAGSAPGGNFGNMFTWQSDADEVPEPLRDLAARLTAIPAEQWIAFAVAAACLALLLILITTVVRYVLQAGIYRSLDQLELAGLVPTVRGAWREGWHGRTWRLWLQNIVIDVPFAIVAVLTLLPAIIPFVLMIVGAEEHRGAPVLAGLTAAGYCCLWFLLVFVAGSVVEVLKQLWWRFAVLEDQDFLRAIGSGWRLGRAHARALVMLWLVLLGVAIAWFAVTVALMVGFGLLTALVAGGPAYLLYRATESLLWPLVWGLPVGLVTFALPLVLASGLYQVFLASVWNQAFRQLAGPPAATSPAGLGDEVVDDGGAQLAVTPAGAEV
jgi:hypothetical protein